MARMSRTLTPVPSMRLAVMRGPIPASIIMTPPGVRTIVALPEEPVARMQSSMDIRVSACRLVCIIKTLNLFDYSILKSESMFTKFRFEIFSYNTFLVFLITRFFFHYF